MSTTDSPSARVPDADQRAREFVVRFADAWRSPNLDKHEELWNDDVVLIQPLMGALRGKAACRAAFARLFRLIPDLHATVHRWCTDGEAVFIEFTLSGTFEGRRVAWTAVDRFRLVDGRVAERVSYFDAAPLVLTMARRPRGWRRLIRSRFTPAFETYELRF